MNRFLIVRTDRIGDVLLTTPVSRLLRQRFPSAHIAWWVRDYTAPLLEHNPGVDRILIDRGEPEAEWIRSLRDERFDAAIVAYPRWRVAWTLWRAGIPQRIGPASKLYSALFNRRVWQHRSRGERHEADYNLELLQPLGIPFERTPTDLVLLPEEQERARKFLADSGVALDRPTVCLHPGSGGSSPRWPLDRFLELGRRLEQNGAAVFVTSGPGEEIDPGGFPHLQGMTVRLLAALYGEAQLLVSNSTGPLHIAVAMRTPTVSLYSSEPARHPRRWGPYPAYVTGESTHRVLMPPTNAAPNDLSTISVEAVFGACNSLFASPGTAGRLSLSGES